MTIELSKQQVAEILNCDVRTITAYQNKKDNPLPILIQGKRGTSNTYDGVAVHSWDLNRQLNKLTKDVEDIDLEHERGRLTRAQADLQEKKNAVIDRQVVPLILMELSISLWSSEAKSRLGSIPLKVKKLLPHMKANEIEIIKREIIKVQNSIAKIQIDWESEDVQEALKEFS